MLEETSPVNVGATTSYNATTRVLTINVEAFYTSAATNNYNLLNIAVVQDSVPGPQTGASNYNPSDVLPNGQYLHAHMLRDFVTGQWGDTISNTAKGALFTKTYTYTLPDSVNSIPLLARNTELAIYVTETREDVTQGITLDVINGSNDGNNAPIYGSITGLGNTIKDGAATTASTFNFDFTSNLAGSHDFVFEFSSHAPGNWSAGYRVNGTSYTGMQTLHLTGASANSVSLEVTPGATAALGEFSLKMYPVSDTNNAVEKDFYVISG
ncbi:MAG: Omp28-related outer membrane protein [Owenweeksia sp.]|nr:Omp28-related outer membrane protein [Owenweeksia sp.]